MELKLKENSEMVNEYIHCNKWAWAARVKIGELHANIQYNSNTKLILGFVRVGTTTYGIIGFYNEVQLILNIRDNPHKYRIRLSQIKCDMLQKFTSNQQALCLEIL